jgi:hypothetical protein
VPVNADARFVTNARMPAERPCRRDHSSSIGRFSARTALARHLVAFSDCEELNGN